MTSFSNESRFSKKNIGGRGESKQKGQRKRQGGDQQTYNCGIGKSCAQDSRPVELINHRSGPRPCDHATRPSRPQNL